MAGPIDDLPDGRWKVKLIRPAGAGSTFCDVLGWAELAIELCANLLIVRDPKAMNATRRRVSDLTFDAGHTMLGDAESEFIYNYRERAGTYLMITDALRQAGAQIDAIVDVVPGFLGEARTFIRAATNELDAELRRAHSDVQWWSERIDRNYRPSAKSADRSVLDDVLDIVDVLHTSVGSPLYTVDERGLLRKVENALDRIINATNDAVDRMAELSRQVDGQRDATRLIAEGLRDERTGLATGTLSPGISRILGETLAQTPTLANLVRRLESSGWTFAYGNEGAGSRVDAARQRVVLDGKGVRDPHFAVRELAHMAARARYVEDYGEAGLRANATARATAKAYGVRIDARTQLQLYQARVGASMPIDAQYFDRFPPDVRDVVISYTYGQAGELSLRNELVERFLVQERIQAATPPGNPPRR